MQRRSTTVVVIAGGDPPSRADTPADSVVIAADRGIDHANALGLTIDIGIGDFDSVSADALARATADGVKLEHHPAAKHATDLELALSRALSFVPERILVLGVDGGRLDHLLANVLVLGAKAYAGVQVDAVTTAGRIHVIREERTLEGTTGECLTLLPLHGPARGVSTSGLLFPLVDENLEPGSSRGVSNVFSEPQVRITLREGVLLAIRPEVSL